MNATGTGAASRSASGPAGSARAGFTVSPRERHSPTRVDARRPRGEGADLDPLWTRRRGVLRLFINSRPKSTGHSFLTGLNEAFRDCDGDIAARALDTGRRGSFIFVVRSDDAFLRGSLDE